MRRKIVGGIIEVSLLMDGIIEDVVAGEVVVEDGRRKQATVPVVVVGIWRLARCVWMV